MKQRIHRLDVRPDIHAGREPLPRIANAFEQLPEGAKLRLIAPFRPVPLLRVMLLRGFSAGAKPLPNGDWEITFERIADIATRAATRGRRSRGRPRG